MRCCLVSTCFACCYRCAALQVVGVSFHVGSGCQNVGVYADAISAARQTFDIAASYGFAMELLDIGGGFTAPYDEVTGRLFYQTAGVINDALERYFPPGCGVRVIAEPGRCGGLWAGAALLVTGGTAVCFVGVCWLASLGADCLVHRC